MKRFEPSPCISDDGIEARIPDTSLSVLTLIEARNRLNSSAEELKAGFQISLAQVYAALAYYHANQGLFEAELTRQQQEREQSLQALFAQQANNNEWADIVGQWPGDETDEEINSALERLS